MTQSPSHQTRIQLLAAAAEMLAQAGYEGTTMRKLADSTGVKQPLIYYYFDSKEALLSEAFELAQQRLQAALSDWPASNNARQLLEQRIRFTWRHAHLVMTMLNYFLGQKRTSGNISFGRIPPQAYRHIQQAIDLGIAQGRYQSTNPSRDASIIVHAINGFAMEHYPRLVEESEPELLSEVCAFFDRALHRSAHPDHQIIGVQA